MRKQTFYILFLIFICAGSLFGQSGKTISDVIVNGFANVDQSVQSEVRAIASSIIGQSYNEGKVEDITYEIDKLGFFSRITHSVFSGESTVIVAFNITENPIIRNVIFVGNKSVSSEVLASMITNQAGKVLSDQKVHSDADIINAYFKKNGYEWSFVTGYEQRETDIPNVSDLVFEIIQPIIGSVTITGNKRTRDNVLITNIEFRTGQVFNINKYLATQNNLAAAGIFEDIEIRILPGIRPDVLDLEVYIVEAKTGSANLGANWNQEEGFGGFVGISDYNFVGTGHRLNLNLQFNSSDNSYNFSYTNPYVDNKLTSATLSIYDNSHTREVMLKTGNANYSEKRVGSTISISRPINERRTIRVYLTGRFDNLRGNSGTIYVDEDYDDDDEPIVDGGDDDDPIDGGGGDDSGDPAIRLVSRATQAEIDQDTLAQIMAPATVRALSATITRDTRFPNQLRPRQGSLYTLSVENAGIFGGVDYTTVSGEARKYINIRKDKNEERIADGQAQDWIYAVRLKAGFSTGNVPYLDQFMVGGSETLRGFQTDQFVGAYQLLLNQELRIPIRKEIGVVAFVDIGDAWGGRFVDRGLARENMELNIGYGLGLRVDSPIGPLRFDYGFSKEKKNGQFTFGMGTTF